jgi:hypothetical protein
MVKSSREKLEGTEEALSFWRGFFCLTGQTEGVTYAYLFGLRHNHLSCRWNGRLLVPPPTGSGRTAGTAAQVSLQQLQTLQVA